MLYGVVVLGFILFFLGSSAQSNQVCLTVSSPSEDQQRRQHAISQGPPGRRGPQGPPGPKGDVGPSGQCACDSREIDDLREKIRVLNETNTFILQHADKVTKCSVGLKDGRIPNEDITASTYWSSNYAPHLGRLDNRMKRNLHQGAWAAGTSYPRVFPQAGDWIQVDLKAPTYVTGVVTQGRPQGSEQWVTSYTVSFGNSSSNMQFVKAGNNPYVFQGNRDVNSKVTNYFEPSIIARYIRLVVQTFQAHATLRLEYLTC
ncbi:unnamed protein product [Clavelina lepadiformis]|uniref:F5/8 type C domain-containing protein n=1 Tax=Clavelina lepadiformis TaxID=159417 RepID=A0ABP0FP86_CLALP